MYVHKKWLCEDCNRAWAKRSKELAGQEFTFVVNHDEKIPTDPNQFQRIEATWIPPFQRFLKLFLPDTKHKFVKFRRPANHNVVPRSPRQLPNHIDFVFRNLGFYAPPGSDETDHWAQSVSFSPLAPGTYLEFKHSATDNGLEHLMLCLIHEFTAHIHIARKHPDIQHYTHRDSNYGSMFLPIGHPEKDFTGHCKQDYTKCLNGMVYSSAWTSNPEMKKLLQLIGFGKKPPLGFRIPISFKFKAVHRDETKRKLGSREKRKLGSRDNPPKYPKEWPLSLRYLSADKSVEEQYPGIHDHPLGPITLWHGSPHSKKVNSFVLNGLLPAEKSGLGSGAGGKATKELVSLTPYRWEAHGYAEFPDAPRSYSKDAKGSTQFMGPYGRISLMIGVRGRDLKHPDYVTDFGSGLWDSFLMVPSVPPENIVMFGYIHENEKYTIPDWANERRNASVLRKGEKIVEWSSRMRREKFRIPAGDLKGKAYRNPPQGLGFVAAQYNFDMPLPLIDFEGTIEDLQSAGFNAEQTFNMSGGDSIKQIKSKGHPGFSAWMNENSTKVKFRVSSEKTDEELLAFKRAIQDALGIKKNPADDEVPKKEELEGESLISKLKKAKEYSDVGNYKEKKIILETLMKESPDDWIVDQPKGEDGSGNFPGIKHKSTNFQFHLPKNAIPNEIKVEGQEPAPTVEKETKESEKEEKKKLFRPYLSETQKNMRVKSRITFQQIKAKTNPPVSDKGRLTLDGVMEPSVHVLKKAFGFPRKGDVLGKFKITDVKIERKLRAKHTIYDFPWQIVCQVDGEATKKEIEEAFERYMRNREVIPADLGASYMVELGFIEYEITKANRLYITGKAVAKRILTNPAELDKDGQLYIKDFSPVSQKRVERKFRTEKLKGEMPSDDFLRQIYGKCQLFGEAAGWVLPNNTMKWKRGHPLLNETRVDGFVVPDATAYWHTHPKAFEPSQTSPDDFLIYHGLFTNNDMCNFFTVMSDRIDHFIFKKKDKIDKEIIAETILEFEDDVRVVFEDAMEEYQTGLKDNEALDTQKQTAHIVKKLNKLVPEFHCTFKCYKIDPKTIIANS